jgi:hypothetical protein
MLRGPLAHWLQLEAMLIEYHPLLGMYQISKKTCRISAPKSNPIFQFTTKTLRYAGNITRSCDGKSSAENCPNGVRVGDSQRNSLVPECCDTSGCNTPGGDGRVTSCLQGISIIGGGAPIRAYECTARTSHCMVLYTMAKFVQFIQGKFIYLSKIVGEQCDTRPQDLRLLLARKHDVSRKARCVSDEKGLDDHMLQYEQLQQRTPQLWPVVYDGRQCWP